jgi:urease accessory protein
MIHIHEISGNVFQDERFMKWDKAHCERIRLSRADLQKNRFRCMTDRETDVGWSLDDGLHVHDGDVIIKDAKTIIVIEQMPEKIMTIKLKEGMKKDRSKVLVLLGHVIGNRHRPISFSNSNQYDAISFPIQSEDEKDTFAKLFAGLINDVELSTSEDIFKPHPGANVHEHA